MELSTYHIIEVDKKSKEMNEHERPEYCCSQSSLWCPIKTGKDKMGNGMDTTSASSSSSIKQLFSVDRVFMLLLLIDDSAIHSHIRSSIYWIGKKKWDETLLFIIRHHLIIKMNQKSSYPQKLPITEYIFTHIFDSNVNIWMH